MHQGGLVLGDGEKMLKLSISLPNSALITLESDGSEPVQEVLALVLGSMQSDGRLVGEPHVGAGSRVEVTAEKGNGVTGPEVLQEIVAPPIVTNGLHPDPVRGHSAPVPSMVSAHSHRESSNGWNGHITAEGGDRTLDLGRYSQEARQDFVAFCEAVNPTGDMRRVVVATEAAERFFGLEGVTADEAGELFDLIGWRKANNFTQTVRNAARSKFGWLERIPGRAGRYAATDVGRSTTLSG